ncbi:MAG: hypothetical protein KGI29_05520 [Pseudomonadota bacterium]|nr:hypothetical protein [Pseudomonadota bacterium]MDE3037784.1 hypothetical protein [Pseudomonadota bacterium]
MKLQEWIALTGIKQNQLARLLGISDQRTTRILKHGLIPHPEEMTSIYWITFGAVRPDDFYELTGVPAEIRHLLEPSKRRNRHVRIDDSEQPGQRERNRWKGSALDH